MAVCATFDLGVGVVYGYMDDHASYTYDIQIQIFSSTHLSFPPPFYRSTASASSPPRQRRRRWLRQLCAVATRDGRRGGGGVATATGGAVVGRDSDCDGSDATAAATGGLVRQKELGGSDARQWGSHIRCCSVGDGDNDLLPLFC
uniref:Uncharacterized protein n=1 Tax=Oryza sativa subsp. japonica TaxID=39947 RepID=Q6ZAK6_ORYSJ|nr:hypothetical protein [Oryza sativa Japonica Group]